jgi:predicted DCC family thiol-disulfide oxidoreductase YuxK
MDHHAADSGCLVSATPAAGAPSSPATIPPPEGAIVFFDGVCSLCNAAVDFLMRHDRSGRLRFASLQGETAARLLPAEVRQELRTLVLRTETGARYVRSAAAVRILWRLGGGWKFAAAALWVIPWPLRDLGYRLTAALRYRLFGRRETCRVPAEADAARLLP